MESEIDFTPTLRLHHLSWLFAIVGLARQMIIPLVAVFFFNMRDNDPESTGLVILATLVGILLVRSLWHQWTYRYGFGPRGLVIREGLIFRNVRQIEYPRIENIDTVHGLLHRLLGVVEVRVQTSTGGKPEALIKVLDEDAVEEIRSRVFDKTAPKTALVAPAAATSLLHLPVTELVRHGLIDNRGIILVAAGIGALHEFGFFRNNPAFFERLFSSIQVEDVFALSLIVQIALAAITALLAIVSLRVLSVILAIVTLYDFMLTREEGELRARYGLLTRITLTLRARRIQVVHQTQTLLHRLFNRVSLNVDLAGDSGSRNQESGEAKMKTRWLAPICMASQAPALITAALHAVDLNANLTWQSLARGARGRVFRRGAAISILLLAGPAMWYLKEHAVFVVLGLIPLAWIHAHLYVKYTRWALTADALLFRSGWLTRRLTIVPRDRVQSLCVGISPFDRRSGMASVSVDTAGSGVATVSIKIRYLAAAEAERLAASLAAIR